MAFCKALLPTCKCIYRVWLLAAAWDAEGISHGQTDNSAELGKSAGQEEHLALESRGHLLWGMLVTWKGWDHCPSSAGFLGHPLCLQQPGMLQGSGSTWGRLQLCRPLQGILSSLGKQLELLGACLNGWVNLPSLWTLPGSFLGMPSGVSLKGAAQACSFTYFLMFLWWIAHFHIRGRVGLKNMSVVVSTGWSSRYILGVKRFEALWKLNLETLLGEFWLELEFMLCPPFWVSWC